MGRKRPDLASGSKGGGFLSRAPRACPQLLPQEGLFPEEPRGSEGGSGFEAPSIISRPPSLLFPSREAPLAGKGWVGTFLPPTRRLSFQGRF